MRENLGESAEGVRVWGVEGGEGDRGRHKRDGGMSVTVKTGKDWRCADNQKLNKEEEEEDGGERVENWAIREGMNRAVQPDGSQIGPTHPKVLSA